MPIVTLSSYTTNSTNYALGTIRRSGFGFWSGRNTVSSSGTVSQTTSGEFAGTGFTGGGRGTFICSRAYMWFDVSSYQGVVINSAYVQGLTTAVIGQGIMLDLILTDSSAFNGNSSVTLNSSQFTDTNFTAYSSQTGWTNSTGFQNLTLNTTGINALQSGNNFGVCIMNYEYDQQNNNPPSGLAFDIYHLADLSSSARPRWTLNIDYAAGGWTGGDVNGVSNSDIDEINGVPKSDISELNGV